VCDDYPNVAEASPDSVNLLAGSRKAGKHSFTNAAPARLFCPACLLPSTKFPAAQSRKVPGGGARGPYCRVESVRVQFPRSGLRALQ